jgi:hypothetical protein
VDDTEAIRQLVARAAFAFDETDVDQWLTCWTADGRLHRTNGESVSGHPALAEYLRGFPGRGRHVVTNSIIEIQGDRATHRAYVQYFDREAQHALLLFGVYDDQIARDGEAWRFTSRRAFPDA